MPQVEMCLCVMKTESANKRNQGTISPLFTSSLFKFTGVSAYGYSLLLLNSDFFRPTPGALCGE